MAGIERAVCLDERTAAYGQLRCLGAATGERIWETQAVTVERARWASAFIVRHEDRFFINNDRGDLIIARMTLEGYEEISRTHLIAPTSEPGNRRELKTVNWSHPAYANQRIYARNDEEIIAASLAAPGITCKSAHDDLRDPLIFAI